MDKYSKTRFNRAPTIYKGRTMFDMSHDILTTFNTGELVPILCEPVYPGDTFSLKTTSLTRLETALHQTMDNAYIEFAYFFVPSRILWSHFENYQGFNNDAWALETEFTKPQLILGGSQGGAESVAVGSLLNHLALPAGSYGYSTDKEDLRDAFLHIDALPLRAVFSVYNEYFRNPNLDSVIYYDDGDYDVCLDDTYLFNGSYFNPATSNLHVNRFPDLFSRALPAPQKGQPVSFSFAGLAPVITGSSHSVNTDYSLHFVTDADGDPISTGKYNVVSRSGDSLDFIEDDSLNTDNAFGVVPDNLWVDASSISSVTINQLRLSIALQAIKERDARSGNRLREKLYAVWHVDAPALELDIPEFLGGKRIPINMMEVLQTSETGTTVLGTDAGHSKTVDSDDSFIKSFTQWGYIVGFAFVRTARSYSQGIDRKFFVENILDEYDPMLDNTGEVKVMRGELQSLLAVSALGVEKAQEAFGFQENWYWLKERLNRFSGYFQPGVTYTMDSWHYGDDYGSSTPYLSASWSKEGSTNVDRTIAVSSEASYQWSINIHFEMKATREMGKYSIPNTFGF